jgi:outer membrane protein OmpA-like peptidoglycan-associated protein
VTFEVDQGGKSFLISGMDGQYKLTNQFEVGVMLTHDSNPLQPATLKGANATYKITEKTVAVGEVASTNTLKGKGSAERVELRYEGDKLQGRVYAGRSDVAFDNAASILNNGRQETGGKGTYKLADAMTLTGEMIDSRDKATGSKRSGVLANLDTRINDFLRVETGMRDSNETTGVTGISPTHITSARVKSTLQNFGISNLSVNGEYEQDIRNSGKKVASLGAEYQMMNRGKLYARHEFVSTLASSFALNQTQSNNTTVVGMDTDYTPDTHLFSEYRARGAIDGAQAEAALGLRNKWQLDEGLKLNTSAENVVNMAGANGRASQAYTGALEYTGDPLWKGSTRLEYRNADTTSGWLNSIDAARKLNSNWTIIGKEVFSESRTKGVTSSVLIQQRVQVGLAWREWIEHEWNALGKVEHRRESDSSAANNIYRVVDILTLHANYQPRSFWQASGHYAAKWVTDKSMGLNSHSNAHLFSGRVMWDITERWDFSLNTSFMTDQNFRSFSYGLGGEVGYLIHENIWISVGYNVFGFREPDMIGQSRTDKGVFLRLRFKFDEDLFNDIFMGKPVTRPTPHLVETPIAKASLPEPVAVEIPVVEPAKPVIEPIVEPAKPVIEPVAEPEKTVIESVVVPALPAAVASLPDSVHFAYNQDTISPETDAILRTVADTLRLYPLLRLELVGHTDKNGDERYNLELSQRRVIHVNERLIELGLEEERMQIRALGKSSPLSSTNDVDIRTRERRVQLIILNLEESANEIRLERKSQESDLQPESTPFKPAR